jgi:hypothetical protein
LLALAKELFVDYDGLAWMRALAAIDIGLVVEHGDHEPRGLLEPLD